MTRFSLPSQLRTSPPTPHSPQNQNTNNGLRVNPARRRNGKPPSCEPCRRGKLRCDHVLPTCGRCARRGLAAKCVWHPAPLTKVRNVRGVGAGGVRDGGAAANTADMVVDAVSAPSDAGSLDGGVGVVAAFYVGPATPSPSPPQLRSHSATGVLGSTSYAAVLAEQEEGEGSEEAVMDMDMDAEAERQEPPSSSSSAATATAATSDDNGPETMSFHALNLPDSPAPPDLITHSTTILSLLQNLPVYERLIERWYSVSGGGIITPSLLLKQWTTALWTSHGNTLLRQHQHPQQLRALAHRVWHNSSAKWAAESGVSAREWAARGSGTGLRWEVVGVTLAVVGLACSVLPEWEPLLQSVGVGVGVDMGGYDGRRAAVARFTGAAEACLRFCEGSGLLCDVGVWLMYEVHALFVFLNGEASYPSYQRSGHIFNALIALGWHQQSQRHDKQTLASRARQAGNCQPPFFLAELRTRLFAAAFAHDKWQAAYLGRPPRLSYRYCSVRLPLDVDEETLLGVKSGDSAEGLEREIEGSGGGRRRWARAWRGYCRVREEILEFAMGDFCSEEDVVTTATHLEARAQETWCALPPHLRSTRDPVATAAAASSPPVERLYLVFIRLECLHNEFLLWRAVLRHLGPVGGGSGTGAVGGDAGIAPIGIATEPIGTEAETAPTHNEDPAAKPTKGKTEWRNDAASKLLQAAQSVLDGVVAAAGRGELCLGFQDAWTMLTSPGLPAACTLAAELLRLHRHTHTHAHASSSLSRSSSFSHLTSTQPCAPTTPLNRSHAIQSLAIYLAALARIPPQDPSARICARGRAFVARALDRVLGCAAPAAAAAAPAPPVPATAAAATAAEATATATTAVVAGGNSRGGGTGGGAGEGEWETETETETGKGKERQGQEQGQGQKQLNNVASGANTPSLSATTTVPTPEEAEEGQTILQHPAPTTMTDLDDLEMHLELDGAWGWECGVGDGDGFGAAELAFGTSTGMGMGLGWGFGDDGRMVW